MKNIFSVITFASLFFATTLLSGCLKDECQLTHKIYLPVYKTLTEVRAQIKSVAPTEIKSTGKIYVHGNYIFVNEVDLGIHVIDNSNPAAPKNVSFIDIRGNVDMAVKGDYLYVDSYSDMVVFDISDPANAVTKKFVNNVFPDRSYFYSGTSTNPDSVNVLITYEERDTTVDCNMYRMWSGCPNCMYADASGALFSAAAPKVSKGGSMARFAITGSYLYSVSYSQLSSFDVSNATDPQLVNTENMGWGIETIYPFKNNLFIGSNNGLFIYSLANASAPSLVSQFSHVRSCDPVVAEDDYAFVTLRSGNVCAGFTDQLEVLQITDIAKPSLLKTYKMHNPHGLAKEGDLLFICDGDEGLKVYNAADVNDITLIKTIGGMKTYDVILNNGVAIVVAEDGLYQFDYSDSKNIHQISKLSI